MWLHNKFISSSFNVSTLTVTGYHTVLPNILENFNAIFITFEVMLKAETIGCGRSVCYSIHEGT